MPDFAILPPNAPAAVKLLRLAALAHQNAQLFGASTLTESFGQLRAADAYRLAYRTVTEMEITDEELDALVEAQRDQPQDDE